MTMTPLQKLPKNVRDLDKLFFSKGFKKLPKSKKSPNLVTLHRGECERTIIRWLVNGGDGGKFLIRERE